MSTSFKATILGRAGSDPSVTTAASGTRMANLSLAHDIYSGGNKTTMWQRITAFGGMADRLANIKKGQRALIEGDLRERKWTDKEGNARTTMELVAQHIVYIDFAPKPVETEAPTEGSTGAQEASEETPSDMP